MSEEEVVIEDNKEEEVKTKTLKERKKARGYLDHKSLPLTKETVELIFAECLNQTKASLDVLVSQILDKNKSIKMTKTDNLLATFRILEFEMQNVLNALEGFNDASLSKKHRMCRKVLKAYYNKLRKLQMFLIKSINNGKVVRFAKLITSFLTDMHELLHVDTSPKNRKAIVERVCEG
tara:strand:+ start:164 stop:697 length:534 start_codon:yes stop_codon:yes gene_type:complete